MKTIFFVGNKRSCTSILVQSLNIHPEIYVLHESDLLWIIYQLYEFGTITFYKNDNSVSTKLTMRTCEDILANYKNMSRKECFIKCHEKIMKSGTPWQEPAHKTLKVVGDKKPSQTLEIMDWTNLHFPDSIFVHIIRHPLDFLRSSKRLPDSVKILDNKSDQQYLDFWTENEMAVERLKSTKANIISINNDEFLKDQEPFLNQIWEKLDLPKVPISLKFEKKVRSDKFSRNRLSLNAKLPNDAINLIEKYNLKEEQPIKLL